MHTILSPPHPHGSSSNLKCKHRWHWHTNTCGYCDACLKWNFSISTLGVEVEENMAYIFFRVAWQRDHLIFLFKEFIMFGRHENATADPKHWYRVPIQSSFFSNHFGLNIYEAHAPEAKIFFNSIGSTFTSYCLMSMGIYDAITKTQNPPIFKQCGLKVNGGLLRNSIITTTAFFAHHLLV